MRLLCLLAALTLLSAYVAADSNVATSGFNVNVSELALVDIEGTAGNLSITSPTGDEAGKPPTEDDDSATWMNYTVIVDTGDTKTVNAKASATVAGCALDLTAAADAGGGAGTVGTSAGTITLSTSDQPLVTGIGSCYTGDGTGKGHNLTYDLSITNMGNVRSGTTAIVVTFTLDAVD